METYTFTFAPLREKEIIYCSHPMNSIPLALTIYNAPVFTFYYTKVVRIHLHKRTHIFFLSHCCMEITHLRTKIRFLIFIFSDIGI